MKKITLLLLVFLISIDGYGQTITDGFGSEIITWLGLDFTHLKYIDIRNYPNGEGMTPEDLRTIFFSAWNKLIVDERIKYDVAGAVRRDNIGYNIQFTEKANEHAADDFFTNKLTDFKLLTKDSISSLVSKYDFHGKSGIGLMFFVEGMCKDKLEASMWVTFVDMGKHKVLSTKETWGRAGGIGFRNFWAKCFYNVISDLASDMKMGRME